MQFCSKMSAITPSAVVLFTVGYLFSSFCIFVPEKPLASTDEWYEIIVMFTKSLPQLCLWFPPPADHLNDTERQPSLILTPNGELCGCCLPPGTVLQAVIVGGCDVMWFVFRERRQWGKNGIQVFHIGIDPFRAGSEERDELTEMSLLEAVCRSEESRPGC